MSLTGGGSGEEHDKQQQQQQQQQPEQRRQQSLRVGTAAGQTPAELAVTTRRTMRGARREGAAGEAYPWLSGGVVGRPRPTPAAGALLGDRRQQFQKSAISRRPLAKANAPSARRRGRTPEPTSSGSARRAGVPAPAIPRSTSLDMLSHSTLISAAAGKSQQASKRSRSWRRPMGRASSTSAGGIGAGGDGAEGDMDEEAGTISFRDAALVAWLNSVLNFEQDDHAHGETLSPVPQLRVSWRSISLQGIGVNHGVRGHKRVRSLSDLKEPQLLSLAVRKISGADEGCDNNNNNNPLARRNSSSGELFPPELSMSAGSSSSLEESGGGSDGGHLSGAGVRNGGVDFSSGGSGRGTSKRHGSLRSMLSFPSGRKRAPSRASTARRMKEDIALLLSGRSVEDRTPPKLPGHMDSAVDRACGGDVDAVRSLLNMLRDHSVLKIARAENGQGLRRRATSCDPPTRFRASGATAAYAAVTTAAAGVGAPGAGRGDTVLPATADAPLTKPKPMQRPVMAPYFNKTADLPAAAGTGAAAAPVPDAPAPGAEGVPPSSGRSSPVKIVPVPAPAPPDGVSLPAAVTAASASPSTRPGGIASKKRGSTKRSPSSKRSAAAAAPPGAPAASVSSRRESNDAVTSRSTNDDKTAPPPPQAAAAAISVAGASSDEDGLTKKSQSAGEVKLSRRSLVVDTSVPARRGREGSATVPRRKLLAQQHKSPVSASLPPKASRPSRQLSVTQPPSPGDDRCQQLPSTAHMAEQAARIAKLMPRSSEKPATATNAALAAVSASASGSASPAVPRRKSVPPAQPANPGAGTTPSALAQASSSSSSSSSPSPLAPAPAPSAADAMNDWAKALSWRSKTLAAANRARTSSETRSKPRAARNVVNEANASAASAAAEGDGYATLPSRRRSDPPQVAGTGTTPVTMAAAAAESTPLPAAATVTSDSARTPDKPLVPGASAGVAGPADRERARSSDTVPPSTASAPTSAAPAAATTSASRKDPRRRSSSSKRGAGAGAGTRAADAKAKAKARGDERVVGADVGGGSRNSSSLRDKLKVSGEAVSPASPPSSGEAPMNSTAAGVTGPQSSYQAPPLDGSEREGLGDSVASEAAIVSAVAVDADGPGSVKPTQPTATETTTGTRTWTVTAPTREPVELPLERRHASTQAQPTGAPHDRRDIERTEKVRDWSAGQETVSPAAFDLRRPGSGPTDLSGTPAPVDDTDAGGKSFAASAAGAAAAGTVAGVAARNEKAEEEAAAAALAAENAAALSISLAEIPAVAGAERAEWEGREQIDARVAPPPPAAAAAKVCDSPAAIPATPAAGAQKEEGKTEAAARLFAPPTADPATTAKQEDEQEDDALVAAPVETTSTTPAVDPASQATEQTGEDDAQGALTVAAEVCASPAPARTSPLQEEEQEGEEETGTVAAPATAAADAGPASHEEGEKGEEKAAAEAEAAPAPAAPVEVCVSPAAIPPTPREKQKGEIKTGALVAPAVQDVGCCSNALTELTDVDRSGGGDSAERPDVGADETPPEAREEDGTGTNRTPKATTAAPALAQAQSPAPAPEQGPASAIPEGAGDGAGNSPAPAPTPAPAPAPSATPPEEGVEEEVGAGMEGEGADELGKGPGGGGSPAETFGARCSDGVRLIVEFLGGVETVPRLLLVNSSWKAAVLPDQERLYKLLVRRSGVTPRRRAAFWEFMVLSSNRTSTKAKSGTLEDGNGPGGSSPPDDIPDNHSGGAPGGPGTGNEPAVSPSRRHSLAELARQGMASEWSKAIDADVARTFGRRPMSFRGEFGSGGQRDSRRRHWWPESLGGAPLGARTPQRQRSPEKAADGDASSSSPPERRESVDAAAPDVAESDNPKAGEAEGAAAARLATQTPPPRMSSSWSPEQPQRQIQKDEGQGREGRHDGGGGERHSSAAAAAEAAGKTAAGMMERGRGGGEGGGRGEGTVFSTVSTEVASVSTSVRGSRSLSSVSNPTGGFSTLSPLSSPASNFSSGGEEGEEETVEDGGGGRRGQRVPPSPGTIRQLEGIKAQLTDALRAIAVAFGDVGYCQGLDYVVAHLIKCLGTDAHVGFGSDPERVFKVILGLFRDYGLEHIYSVNLEALQLMLGVLDHLIETRLPSLHQHFRDQDVDVAFFAVGWFQTLFLYNSRMPSDTIMWLWDNWVTERSYKVFFRAALAILKLSEPMLLQLDLESIMTYLSRFPHGGEWVLEKENLVPAALSIKITDAILREAQRKLDLIKKRGATGVGWTRPSPPTSARDVAATAAASAPSSAHNNPPLHLLHEPAYSDGHAATTTSSCSSSSPPPPPHGRRERERHSHEDVHGSDAPPVQAALRGSGCGGARTAAGGADSGRGVGAKGDRHSAATAAAEGIFGRENRHGTGSGTGVGSSAASPRSAPRALPKHGLKPMFNTERSDRSLGDLGVVVPVPATVTGSSGRVPSFGVDMSALSGGGGDKVAVRKAQDGAAGDEGGWAPTPSPLIFGSHSIDTAERGGKGAAGSSGATGACAGRGSGGGSVGRRSEHASSRGPVTPVSPSKGPPYFAGGTPRQGPPHVWPVPKAAAAAAAAENEVVEEHAYDSDDDDDAAMPPVMVPLHRAAQPSAPSASGAGGGANSDEAAGGRSGGKTASGPPASGAKKSTPPKRKLGGKAEYAMLFSGGNE
eukprot:g10175.t1